jgi:hypothetical protein
VGPIAPLTRLREDESGHLVGSSEPGRASWPPPNPEFRRGPEAVNQPSGFYQGVFVLAPEELGGQKSSAAISATRLFHASLTCRPAKIAAPMPPGSPRARMVVATAVTCSARLESSACISRPPIRPAACEADRNRLPAASGSREAISGYLSRRRFRASGGCQSIEAGAN